MTYYYRCNCYDCERGVPCTDMISPYCTQVLETDRPKNLDSIDIRVATDKEVLEAKLTGQLINRKAQLRKGVPVV